VGKKVLILVNHDIVIYNFRRELVERLLSEECEVIISSPYGERISDLLAMGCKYLEIELDRHGTNPISELRLLAYYKRIMREIKPDIVLLYTIKPNIWGGIAAKDLRIPYIANITGLGTAVENEGWVQKISVLLYKVAFKKAHKVFLQNTENQEFFVKHRIALNSHGLIPGSGVNLEHFRLLDYPSDSKAEFVFISRIMKEKGIDQYIEAAKYITKKYPNTKFHVCGFCEEDYYNILSDLQNQSVLTYHGMIRDVREILKKTHCTVHPTYYPEGLSNVLLESAASGRPIITTDRSGCREVVEDGINGYVVEQRSSEDLIDKIEKFIALRHEEKKMMGLAARAKVEREFDRQIVVEAYLDEIEKIVCERVC